MSKRNAIFFLVLAGALGVLLSRTAPAQTDSATLIEAMQAGGTVIFLRHAATNASEVDTGRLGDRAGQRNLSPEGIEQARALGEAYRALGIAFDRIIVSPVFRARDTAELAFGPVAIEISMDVVADDYAGGQIGQMIQATRRLLATSPPQESNLLLVGHRTPLQMATGLSFPDTILPEGAMAIFRPGGGETELLGTVRAEHLIAAAMAQSSP